MVRCALGRSRAHHWSGSGVYTVVWLVLAPVQGGCMSCYVDYKIGAGFGNVQGVAVIAGYEMESGEGTGSFERMKKTSGLVVGP